MESEMTGNVAGFLAAAFLDNAEDAVVEEATEEVSLTEEEIKAQIDHLNEQITRQTEERDAMQAKCNEVYPAFLEQKAKDVAAFAAQKDAEWEKSSGPAKVKELQAGIEAANGEIKRLKGLAGLKE